ncbi:MAG TPA: hypothetical protein VI160_07985 [Gemmatimonadales bacterium]
MRLRRIVARTALALALLGCNEGLAPVPVPTSCPRGFVGICGHITFRGAVPDSTDVVYLVAYAAFPQSKNDLFTFLPVPPPTLPLPGDSVIPYTLAVPNGVYHWVLAVWKKVGNLTIANADTLLRETGYYRDPADTTKPGVVIVNGVGTDSINFVVDFAVMHPVSFYFPAPPR